MRLDERTGATVERVDGGAWEVGSRGRSRRLTMTADAPFSRIVHLPAATGDRLDDQAVAWAQERIREELEADGLDVRFAPSAR